MHSKFVVQHQLHEGTFTSHQDSGSSAQRLPALRSLGRGCLLVNDASAAPATHSRLQGVLPNVPYTIAGPSIEDVLDAVLNGTCVGGIGADTEFRWAMGGADTVRTTNMRNAQGAVCAS